MIFFNALERRVRQAQSDPAEANRLISEYQPFIAKTVGEHIGRYVPQEDSDEFSVALSAFNEAIVAYRSEKGKFLPFASQIIRLRLIDLYRRQSRGPQSISLDAGAENPEYDITAPAAIRNFEVQNENLQRRYEIMALTDALAPWGITFTQMAEHSPKQEALRAQYLAVARTLAGSKELKAQLVSTRKLPIRQLIDACHIDRKRLERGRIYIIGCFVILDGDYPFLQEYLKWK